MEELLHPSGEADSGLPPDPLTGQESPGGQGKSEPLLATKHLEPQHRLRRERGGSPAESGCQALHCGQFHHGSSEERPCESWRKCLSLQMSLHYAKVSENVLYKKWKETEDLGILHLASNSTGKTSGNTGKDSVCYEHVRKGLDAVRVPFGVCFKPAKLACRTQLKHCLECASFCSTRENEIEYREEIKRVGVQIAIGKRTGRQEWVDKNQEYLDILLRMVERIRREGIVHKNGSLREDTDV